MFTQRSQEKELIDLGRAHYTQEEYTDCLNKLFRINQLLGFLKHTIALLKSFSKHSTLLDVGCGNGRFLLHLSKRFQQYKMLGVDINEEAIQAANNTLNQWQENQLALNVVFQLQSQPELPSSSNSVDIILATLVCHHLSDDELVSFLKQAYANSRQAVIINDLHRHRLSEWLYQCFSPLIFRNRLITHDGLISIRRGFIRSEWKLLLEKAGIHRYQIRWRFPFCWSVVLYK